jgi:hypothetical protein
MGMSTFALFNKRLARVSELEIYASKNAKETKGFA